MQINFKQELKKLGLNNNNCIIIGSGILQALGIRPAYDIDLVVKQDVYDLLKKSYQLIVSKNHGNEILKNDLFEIGTQWVIFEKPHTYDTLLKSSQIVDDLLYIRLDFLLRVKKSWIKNKTSRPKDFKDIELITKYIKMQENIRV